MNLNVRCAICARFPAMAQIAEGAVKDMRELELFLMAHRHFRDRLTVAIVDEESGPDRLEALADAYGAEVAPEALAEVPDGFEALADRFRGQLDELERIIGRLAEAERARPAAERWLWRRE